MSSDLIIAFDPGINGAVAMGTQHQVIAAYVLPKAGKELDIQLLSADISNFLSAYPGANPIGIIEKVGAMPGQGVTSMFSFGKVYGMLQGLLAGYHIPIHLVTPQSWKKVVLAGTSKDKDAAIAYCRRVYPQIDLKASPRCRKAHDGIADAICLWEYAKEKSL